MLNHKSLRILGALVWLIVGISLLRMGLLLLSSIVLMALGLAIGYAKGRFVLRKSALRTVSHIASLPNPAPFWRVYDLKLVILVACMMGIGIALRVFHAPDALRGVVLTAVGAALIQGSIFMFRQKVEAPA